ncbi:MAG: phosphate ABC transporter permease PstA [Candidatus Cloacimonadales bacterium]
MINRRKISQFVAENLLRAMIFLAIGFLAVFLTVIISRGFSVISWEFVSKFPRRFMTQGGIYPAIVGTFWLTSIAILIALPIGIMTAIYMNIYTTNKYLLRILRTTVNTLAGVPSIIYGLFGLAVFVQFMQMDVSILAGASTLAILILPMIINVSEEALCSVPNDFREASLALGATERQTMLKTTLPAALPGILTGAILSVGRAAGETAPILFTAATFYSRRLPKSLSDEVMALPYHIYALMMEGTHPEQQVPIAYGTALVLLSLVILISLVAIIIRYKMRKTRKW